MNTTPSLETIAELYKAAHEQRAAAMRGVALVVKSAQRHGYTEEQLSQATGLTIVFPVADADFEVQAR